MINKQTQEKKSRISQIKLKKSRDQGRSSVELTGPGPDGSEPDRVPEQDERILELTS